MKYIEEEDMKANTWYLVEHYDGFEFIAYHVLYYRWIAVYPNTKYIELMDEGDIRYVLREVTNEDILPFIPPALIC